jgi:hypothetical protein
LIAKNLQGVPNYVLGKLPRLDNIRRMVQNKGNEHISAPPNPPSRSLIDSCPYIQARHFFISILEHATIELWFLPRSGIWIS